MIVLGNIEYIRQVNILRRCSYVIGLTHYADDSSISSIRDFSQWLADRIKWPSIVVMAIVGLLVGPILGITNPKEALGSEVFSPIVSLAVAIILFEGSSNLDFRELKGISKAVIRIITVGAVIAWILGAIALHTILNFPISVSFVMGGLFLITGPTVIQTIIKTSESKEEC